MFTKEDEALHKGLMKLLDEGTFHLQAREVKAFLVIYDWVKKLPQKSQPMIKVKKDKNGIK
jgi:hypothetical protein